MTARTLLAAGHFRSDRRAAIETAAQLAGYDIEWHDRADAALARLELPLDAALVDVAMSGAERVCKAARASANLAHAPVIAVTRRLTDRVFSDALRWGAHDVITLTAAGPLAARLSAAPGEVTAVPEDTERDAWRALRMPFQTLVAFRPVGGESDDFGFSVNVGVDDLFVRTLAPSEANDVWLELRPPHSSRRIRVVAQVMLRRSFAEASDDAPAGFALAVVDGVADDLTMLEEGFVAAATEAEPPSDDSSEGWEAPSRRGPPPLPISNDDDVTEDAELVPSERPPPSSVRVEPDRTTRITWVPSRRFRITAKAAGAALGLGALFGLGLTVVMRVTEPQRSDAPPRTPNEAFQAAQAPPLITPVEAEPASIPEPPSSAPEQPGALPPNDAALLPANLGYLLVEADLDTQVFVHGQPAGLTNSWLKVGCGTRFVRLGEAPGQWQSEGTGVVIKCQDLTQLGITSSTGGKSATP